MQTIDVVGAVRRLAGDRARTAASEYERLVRSAADGQPADPAEVADALRECGKTAAQFEADVRRLAKRREMQATAATRPAVDADRQRATAELEALLAEQADFQARIGPRFAAVHQRLQYDIPARDRAIDDAEKWLRTNDPAAVAERKQAERDALLSRIVRGRSGGPGGLPYCQIEKLEAELAALDHA